MLASVNDGVLLMLVAMLNFLGAILLANMRARQETNASQTIELPGSTAQPEAVSG